MLINFMKNMQENYYNHLLEFKVSEKSDLVFSGLGWISLSPNTIVAGWAPEGVGVLIRKAMI